VLVQADFALATRPQMRRLIGNSALPYNLKYLLTRQQPVCRPWI